MHSQRSWGLLNGIESEGFPNLPDPVFDDWCGGLNRHNFWQANARPPIFNYINHKWTEPIPGKPGEHRNADVPLARHRLAFAAAQFTDAMICCSYSPPHDSQGRIGIWDEFRQGADKQLGWLGRPEGEAIRLAAHSPDLLAGQNIAARIRGDVAVREHSGAWLISTKDAAATELTFTLPDVSVPSGDLLVLATMQGELRKGYPCEMARIVQLEMSGGQISLSGKAPDIVGQCIRGRKEELLDRSTGAHVSFVPRQTIDGRSLAGYAIHPPYRGNIAGYVYWCKNVEVPAGTELRFSLGMGEKSPARSDGVWFQVWVAEISGGTLGKFDKIFEKSTKAYAWIPCHVPLDKYAGKRVRLKFVADCGPNDDSTTDQGFWGDVQLSRADGPESADNPSKIYMTWLNDRPFNSGFYYRDLKAGKVNLTFHCEGPESVTIQKLAAYAHADAMYRVFKQGLVLANPSHHPYTFDLGAISPGRHYRRLQHTAGQDAEANNGRPVTGSITLGERDALFLMRVP